MTIDELVQQWLLTTAMEFPRHVGYLFPIVEGLALNMPEVPGTGSNGYANGLLALWDSGKIRFSSQDAEFDIETRQGVCNLLDRLVSLDQQGSTVRTVRYGERMSSERVASAVPEPSLSVRFELTELGGEAWERFAEPNWARFLHERTDENTGEMWSSDLTLMMSYLGWSPPFADRQIKRQTVRVERMAEYQILYWKRLPQVYYATFGFEKVNPNWQEGRMDSPEWFRTWWHGTTVWYREPWDLDGWPRDKA